MLLYMSTHMHGRVGGCITPAAGTHEYIFTYTSIVLNPVVTKCFKKELNF